MRKKPARSQLVTHLSFILSYSIDYLKDTSFLFFCGHNFDKGVI